MYVPLLSNRMSESVKYACFLVNSVRRGERQTLRASQQSSSIWLLFRRLRHLSGDLIFHRWLYCHVQLRIETSQRAEEQVSNRH